MSTAGPLSETRRTWMGAGKTVTGASHLRQGKGNQDAIKWFPETQAGVHLAVAIADGHGGERYVRSHVGARLAVEAALEELVTLLDGNLTSTTPGLSSQSRFVYEHLPRRLIGTWNRKVTAHLEADPLSDKDAALSGSPKVAFGCTVLATLVTPDYLVYLQLGDGDIVTVTDEGDPSRPFPRDQRLLGNETTSLASNKAWREVRVAFHALVESPPRLIVLSTDGYANSFRDDDEFLKVGPDLFSIAQSDGFGAIENNLEDWLHEASSAGSGDDVTVGVLWRALDTASIPSISLQSSAVVEEGTFESNIASEREHELASRIPADEGVSDAKE